MKKLFTLGLSIMTVMFLGWATPAWSDDDCLVTGGTAPQESVNSAVNLLEDMFEKFNERDEDGLKHDWDDDITITTVEHGAASNISNTNPLSGYWDLAGDYPNAEIAHCQISGSYEIDDVLHLDVEVVWVYEGPNGDIAEKIDLGFRFRNDPGLGAWVFTGGAIGPRSIRPD